MRLCAKNSTPTVTAMPDTDIRPVRMYLGGMTYRMEPAEALELATQLADAVDELRNTERK